MGTKHFGGKQRVKVLKSRRIYQSLIEEEVKGTLIWLRRPKSRRGSIVVDWGE
jgi:hypothetical protein